MHDATVHVTRRINADPTSAALLLAAPAAAELWPGLRLAGADPGEHISVAVVEPAILPLLGTDQPVEAVIRAEPPVRTPTSFVIRFSFVAGELPRTEGTLTLTYASTQDDGSATDADLRFTIVPGGSAEPGLVPALHGLAGAFLDNLAAAAEQRSRAA